MNFGQEVIMIDVTCNKSSLFASRLKTLKKEKEKRNILVEQEFFLNILKVEDINSFLYHYKEFAY
jgi:hypothetical protein